MTSQANRKNKGGRPKSYEPSLVYQIVSEGLEAGTPATELNADFVKTKLCSEHNVTSTIRKEALEELVATCHRELAEAESQRLLDALPASVAPAVDHVIAAARRDLLLLVAQQNSACQALAEQKCDELRADKRNAQFRLHELESTRADQNQEIEALKKERDEAKAKLLEARTEVSAIRAEMEKLAREANSVDRILTGLRDPAVREDIRSVLCEIVSPPAGAL